MEVLGRYDVSTAGRARNISSGMYVVVMLSDIPPPEKHWAESSTDRVNEMRILSVDERMDKIKDTLPIYSL